MHNSNISAFIMYHLSISALYSAYVARGVAAAAGAGFSCRRSGQTYGQKESSCEGEYAYDDGTC